MVVKIADRQWRYSRFPSLPLFGRAARETALKPCMPSVNRCQSVLRPCRSMCRKPSACTGPSAALSAAIWRWLSRTIRKKIRKLNSRRGELERALSAHESDNQQNRVQYEQAKEGVSALNRLLPRLNLLADDTLADRVDEIRNVWTKRRKPRALFSSTVTSWRSWSLLFRCCRAIRSSLSS